MSIIKVLPLDKILRISRVKDKCIRDMDTYNVKIDPVYNRDGKYYNRFKKIAWLEVDGRAWIISSTHFLYELRLFDHRPLTDTVTNSIKTIFKAGLNNKQLRSLLYMDNDWKDIRASGRSARLHLLRFRK